MGSQAHSLLSNPRSLLLLYQSVDRTQCRHANDVLYHLSRQCSPRARAL